MGEGETLLLVSLVYIAIVVMVIIIFVALLRWILRINTAVDALEFMCGEMEKANSNMAKIIHRLGKNEPC